MSIPRTLAAGHAIASLHTATQFRRGMVPNRKDHYRICQRE